jgi:Uma2 family endonuclease
MTAQPSSKGNARLEDPASGLPPEIWQEPLAESPVHLAVIFYLLHALRWIFRERQDVCIEGDCAVQYDPKDLRRHVAPDVFVSFGVPRKRPRNSYATWIEGKGLDVVFEVTSESSKDEDLGKKLAIYRDVLGVKEYVIFDPKGEWLEPRLRLFRRAGSKLVRVAGPEDELKLSLREIDIDIFPLGDELRVRNRLTGEIVLPVDDVYLGYGQAEDARRQAEDARRQAEETARAALARQAELEAELRRLRGG